MTDPAIQSINLRKSYDSKTEVLKNFTLDIRRGELFTLLGPNGSGKTTFLRIISTQLMPSQGDAYVLGHNIISDAERIRSEIAVVPQDAGTHESFTPWDYSYYYSRLRGMSAPKAKTVASKALQKTGLWELRNRTCGSLSGGESKRAIIAAILASDANVLFLDEPSTGLDAIGRRQVWSYLRQLVESGRTILLTTHNMEEAEMISDRVGIINQGELVTSGTVNEIKDQVDDSYRVIVNGKFDGPLNMETLSVGGRKIAYFNEIDEALELVTRLVKMGYKADIAPVTLEDVFLKLLRGVAS